MNETLLQGKFWLRPLGLLAGEAARMGVAAGMALPLAGGPQSFTHCEILARMPEGGVATALASIIELNRAACPRVESLLERLSKPRPDWAGRPLDRVSIMGIVNVTPDSFSDGGDFIDHDRAIAHGMALWSEGADLLDIGGESTRPGAMPVPEEEEIRRIEPVVRALAKAGAAVSIDTRRARVMEVAMAAGARVINDVSALADDPRSLATAA
ncbi:MAG TPA: dihydropteroate synthase, partial [Stellaceae bacterium]|nr:dihydropteroate synthase [Stellaceae bacterium]